jgi:hypothetical protein
MPSQRSLCTFSQIQIRLLPVSAENVRLLVVRLNCDVVNCDVREGQLFFSISRQQVFVLLENVIDVPMPSEKREFSCLSQSSGLNLPVEDGISHGSLCGKQEFKQDLIG